MINQSYRTYQVVLMSAAGRQLKKGLIHGVSRDAAVGFCSKFNRERLSAQQKANGTKWVLKKSPLIRFSK